MRAIDNYTPEQLETLKVKGMLPAPPAQGPRKPAQVSDWTVHMGDQGPDTRKPASHSSLPWRYDRESNCILDAEDRIMGDISSRNCPFIVRACNEYETLKAQLQVTNATVDHYEQRQLELIKEAGDAKAHAQRLADALRNALNMIDPDVWDKSKESGVLAQWEQDKQ